MSKTYTTKQEIFQDALAFMEKSVREVMPRADIEEAEKKIDKQGHNRKGYLGNLIEEYVFGQEINSRHEADFKMAGVELKTTPVKKHAKNGYAAKERLVFSMIDYMGITSEDWEHSSFLDKNKLILLMFYLYEQDVSILDYTFKFLYELDLVGKIAPGDALQIRKDWEHIVDRIRKGEAHLLSEAETFYLGACTKASDSSKRRQQPNSPIPAKPRAFSLKQKYLNHILQDKILCLHEEESSIYEEGRTIDASVERRLKPFVGMTDSQIISRLGLMGINRGQKQYKRMLANFMVSGANRKIEEFEKSNVTMRVVTLEHDGRLKESISFPYFRYDDISEQKWEDSDFFRVLEEDRFLFVVFRKEKGSGSIRFEGSRFWNFPMSDMPEAERVWKSAKKAVRAGEYGSLPRISDSPVAHVRPHGRNADDRIATPQGTMETKRCFWLNADYVRKSLVK